MIELTLAERKYILACLEVADESGEQADLFGVDIKSLIEKLTQE